MPFEVIDWEIVSSFGTYSVIYRSINTLGGCTHCHTTHSCLLRSSFVTVLYWLHLPNGWLDRRSDGINSQSPIWCRIRSVKLLETKKVYRWLLLKHDHKYEFSAEGCPCEQWRCPWLQSMFVKRPNMNACRLMFPDSKHCQTSAHISKGDGSML